MTTILIAYLVSIPVWMLMLYIFNSLRELSSAELSKLAYSIGEKTIFSSIAVFSKGVYDAVRGFEHQDPLLILLSLPILAFGLYLLLSSKRYQKGD